MLECPKDHRVKEKKHKLMDYASKESKQGNKEGWRRVLILVQVAEKIADKENGSRTPICP